MALDAVDTAELAEMLAFLSGWLVRDPARLEASLNDYADHPAHGIQRLRDLDRFAFPLGSDGEQYLTSDPDQPGEGGATTTDQQAQ